MIALLQLAQAWLGPAVLVFLRVGAIMALLPAFGEQIIPARIRLGLALAFSAVVLPAAPPLMTPTLPAAGAEVLVGLALGAGLRMFVLALNIAAAIAANATSLSQLFAGAGADPQPALGNLLSMAALALALQAGLHVRAAEFMILSYDILPAGVFPDAGRLANWGVTRAGQITALGFALAAPFTIGAVLYNVALGLMNRAMPQLMLSLIGAPALALGGMVVMALATPVLLGVWLQAFLAFVHNPGAGG